MNQKGYRGIDLFRIFAAILVIAIHTSPFYGISEDMDFVFTRIIARTAVPFFFMASGFFLMEGYGDRNQKAAYFVKKTAWIYLASVILYIPLNIYKGYFGADLTLSVLLKDFFIDGMFYHLWYLPASITGMVIAWGLVRKFSYGRALAVTGILYLIGVFGDSYYGLMEGIPAVHEFYENLFLVSGYTRNGFFFAPLFLMLGMMISRQDKKAAGEKGKENQIPDSYKYLTGFMICMTLMIAEGMLLHVKNLQRHDSMYVMLPFVMYFLFRFLCGFREGRIKKISRISLVVYIIHPIVIVALRFVDKLIGVNLFGGNNMLQFLAAVIVSFAAAYVLVKIKDIFFPGKKKNSIKDRAWAELDLDNLEHNVKQLKKIMQEKCKFMAVIKAEAYGHGAVIIAEALNNMGVDAFAVATIEEGIILRENGITGEILILDYSSAERAGELKQYDLIQTVADYEHCVSLNSTGRRIKVHLKIDTGMNRLGFDADDIDNIVKAFSMKNLKICGMYTHLCAADSLSVKDIEFTGKQEALFCNLLENLRKHEINIPKIHLQSSYGLLNYPDIRADYARVGIAMYGTLSSCNDKVRADVDLRPVLSLKSRVVLVRDIKAGENVGYGRCYIAEGDRRIAVISIGYADGIPRSLSCGHGYVLIMGKIAPVVGRICMDQMMVDVTEIAGIHAGCEVILIGKMQDKEIKVTDFAESAESIANEVLSRMGRRIQPVLR